MYWSWNFCEDWLTKFAKIIHVYSTCKKTNKQENTNISRVLTMHFSPTCTCFIIYCEVLQTWQSSTHSSQTICALKIINQEYLLIMMIIILIDQWVLEATIFLHLTIFFYLIKYVFLNFFFFFFFFFFYWRVKVLKFTHIIYVMKNWSELLNKNVQK